MISSEMNLLRFIPFSRAAVSSVAIVARLQTGKPKSSRQGKRNTEADHSLAPSMWSHIFTPSCAFKAWYLSTRANSPFCVL